MTERTKNKLQKFLTENLIFLIIAFLPYYSGSGILNAQSLPQGVSFFTEPMIVSRGTLNPSSPDAEVWASSYWCPIVKSEWGWTSCDGIDAFIVGYNASVDTIIIEKPNSDGFVKFDDWRSDDLANEIAKIEEALIASVKDQEKKIGMPVSFKGWRVFPTLNEEKHVLYYATDIDWNGEVSTNIKISVFDRSGYVAMRVIPTSSSLDGGEIERIVLSSVANYAPNTSEGYSKFVSGDKIAAVGAVGVLATMIGVKYSKGLWAGLMVLLLAVFKKAWILLFLPLIWIKKLFQRKE